MLRNLLYKGWMEVPGWGISRQDDWEPLVGPELWCRVQSVLSGKSGVLQVVHTAANDRFILRGLLVCEGCRKLMTGSKSRSKSGKYAFYYHCIRGCSRIRVDVADDGFVSLLDSLVPETRRLQLLEECFREAWDRRNGSAAADHQRLQSELVTLRRRKDMLLTMREDGEIDGADYSKRYATYNAQIAEIEAALASSADELDVDESWSYLEHLMYTFQSFEIRRMRQTNGALGG